MNTTKAFNRACTRVTLLLSEGIRWAVIAALLPLGLLLIVFGTGAERFGELVRTAGEDGIGGKIDSLNSLMAWWHRPARIAREWANPPMSRPVRSTYTICNYSELEA